MKRRLTRCASMSQQMIQMARKRLTPGEVLFEEYLKSQDLSDETFRLVEEGRLIHAVLNVVLSVTVGFIAVWGGIALARKLERVPASSHALYDGFERSADVDDPHQSAGAERVIRDASIRPKKA